jgi:hypothetical protein
LPLTTGAPAGPPAPSAGRAGPGFLEVIVSRTARTVLAGVLTLGALVVGGVALAANPAPAGPSSTVSVEQGGPAGLRPVQDNDVPDADCPNEGGVTGAAAGRL